MNIYNDLITLGNNYPKRRSVEGDITESLTASTEDTIDVLPNTSTLSASDDFSLPTVNYMNSVTRIESANVQSSLGVCLYGEGETANVTLRPNAFHLGYLKINQSAQRELLIFNNSEVLPIIFKYEKVPFVEVTPKQGLIPPEGGKEVLVKVIPARCGLVKTKIVFKLLYYNFPRKEGEYVVVGKESADLEFEVLFKKPTLEVLHKKGKCGKRNLLTEDIKFSSKVHIPKCIMPTAGKKKLPRDDALIAFPDDRPTAQRPWRRTEE